jgi:hypothetical protein
VHRILHDVGLDPSTSHGTPFKSVGENKSGRVGEQAAYCSPTAKSNDAALPVVDPCRCRAPAPQVNFLLELKTFLDAPEEHEARDMALFLLERFILRNAPESIGLGTAMTQNITSQVFSFRATGPDEGVFYSGSGRPAGKRSALSSP